MKKKKKALAPILAALIATVALGQASVDDRPENNCNYTIEILDGSTSSLSVELNSSSPKNLTAVWRYEQHRPIQSYFRAEDNFTTNFMLEEPRELESVKVYSMHCKNITDLHTSGGS